jgi:hypothetical protein
MCAKDLTLNLGTMYPNGTGQFPTQIRLVLTDLQGNTHDFHCMQLPGGLAGGPMEDFIAPLRAGSTYIIRLPFAPYCRVAPGRYQISASYTGFGPDARPGRRATGITNFWTGTLKSNSREFDLSENSF